MTTETTFDTAVESARTDSRVHGRHREHTRRGFARHLPATGRIALGLVFFVFGLDGFLHFTPPPDPSTVPAGALALGTAMMKTGYLLQLVKGTEVLSGALLLANRFVPLALTLLAPVMVNILAFHAFLAPNGLPMAVVLVAVELCLAWAYRARYRPLLVMRAEPGASIMTGEL